MAITPSMQYCPCCSTATPSSDFPRGKSICTNCTFLDANEASLLTRQTVEREKLIATQTKEGRRRVRQAARMANYQVLGKRCSCCHSLKAPAEYHRLTSSADGLQPICKICVGIRATLSKNSPVGWKQQYRIYRDAMRAQAAAKAQSLPETVK